jgi:hypothetical protein
MLRTAVGLQYRVAQNSSGQGELEGKSKGKDPTSSNSESLSDLRK